ncbi:unnamed protein product [Arctia plantaginis]|uniref:Uncharacterized protein n=1 Tax=Arctia plantaginis TaxID=874455 RepID=A0A8S0Z404_ARCPL|nr:unnamed protein product [Arctia plantaginis]CAB3237765.1 unnamed protein product [Arctia plantaginis]
MSRAGVTGANQRPHGDSYGLNFTRGGGSELGCQDVYLCDYYVGSACLHFAATGVSCVLLPGRAFAGSVRLLQKY